MKRKNPWQSKQGSAELSVKKFHYGAMATGVRHFQVLDMN